VPTSTLWSRIRDRRTDVYICLALALSVFAVYGQVGSFDFVNWDDPSYLLNNPYVTKGVSAEGLRWAWTSIELAHWIPVTRMSELVDVQLFGLRPGPHHLVNVVWHVLTSLLMFTLLHHITGSRWRSALAAFLFALHPLHVESVAWITERKDVLSGFLFFLTLWLYVRYAEHPSTARYLLALFSFVCGLMAKSMLVSLPLVLVLLDFWPLARWTSKTPRWKEKIPFLALSAVASIIEYSAAQSAGWVLTGEAAPFSLRARNALVSYIIYIGKAVWPTSLAIFHPFRRDLLSWQPVVAALVIAGVSIAVVRWFYRRRGPVSGPQNSKRSGHRVLTRAARFRDTKVRERFLESANHHAAGALVLGWFWYLMVLFPVSGVVQTGEQSYAEHFMYLPLAGLLIMLAWALPERPLGLAIGALACMAVAALSYVQVGYWRNTETLFRHALAVTDGNYIAHYQLGVYYGDAGRRIEAIEQYQAALAIKPRNADAWNNLGVALSHYPNRITEAIADYQAALRIRPDFVMAHNNLGAAYVQMPGHMPDAISEYQAALRVQPDDPALHLNLGQAFAAVGKLPEAIAECRESERLRPRYGDDPEFHKNLGNLLASSNRMPEAIGEYQAALRLRPEMAEVHNNLGVALANVEGRLPEAIEQFQAALRIQPDYRDARNNLAFARQKLQKTTR